MSEEAERADRKPTQFACLIVCMDNCQMGQQLHFQLGGSSSNFLLGISLMAIQATLYTDTSYDNLRVEMTYNSTQPIISPAGFPALAEAIDMDNLQESLLAYQNLVSSARPDPTGKEVDMYNKEVTQICFWIEHIECCFMTKDVSIEQNKFNTSKLAKIFECAKDSRAKNLSKCAKDF